jgi:hypothetical protein
VYLTPVGGGVFDNPHEWIQEGLLIALEDFKNFPLKVKMVYRERIDQYNDERFNGYRISESKGGTLHKQSTRRNKKRSKPTRRIKR